MKILIKIVYELFVFFTIKYFLFFLKESILVEYVKQNLFNSSIYTISIFFMFCFMIIYNVFLIVENVFFFNNQGSKLNYSKIDVEKYKKEM